MQEAEMDITELAHNTRRTQGDEYLAVKFYLQEQKDTQKSEEAGRPIFRDVEYIEILQPGNKDNIIRRPATKMDKSRFPQHYQMWKARTVDSQEQVVGTPLTEWAGITRAQAAELSFFNVKTVEQLANMADSNTTGMMGLQGLKQKAVKYLESSADQATVDALAALKAENAEMRELVKQLMGSATQDQPQAAVEHDPLDDIVPRGTTIPKPKRKRRSKAEMVAAKAQENTE